MLATQATKGAQTAQRLRSLALLGAFLIAPLLFLGGPGYSSGPLFKSAWNLGHIGLFALATLGIQPWRWLQGWRLWLIPSGILLIIGVGIEVIQSGLDRQEDWHDVVRNLMGLWLVLAWFPQARRTRQIKLATLATALLVALEILSTAVVAYRQFEVHRQLPRLYDFNHDNPGLYWGGRVSTEPAPNSGLRITLGTEKYSGATLNNLPNNWRGYKTLVIGLENPDNTPLAMTLRIHDVAHEDNNAYSDRFNKRLQLAAGHNSFTIPLETIRQAPENRNMDMSLIRRLGLFATQLPYPRSVILTDLRLQ
ncbi:succinyl-CoA synthetase subunit beta [Marinobacter salinexigens]|uniref:Succinyl-CoA synthetase subunit beta n=1 Tax=Marinobacter salinexigens TaxID=2919747 RepID=A0A5B0VPS7_9GAMM|nr:succinyl-CoA synthetase subunit beta [Marinobacter salinexigens]KAA1176205.1 succinyl-CoA synthetase subunit beta [Marinobacter salinexigens]